MKRIHIGLNLKFYWSIVKCRTIEVNDICVDGRFKKKILKCQIDGCIKNLYLVCNDHVWIAPEIKFFGLVPYTYQENIKIYRIINWHYKKRYKK